MVHDREALILIMFIYVRLFILILQIIFFRPKIVYDGFFSGKIVAKFTGNQSYHLNIIKKNHINLKMQTLVFIKKYMCTHVRTYVVNGFVIV